MAADLISLIQKTDKEGSSLTIAISGGNTPKFLFSVIAEKYSISADWNKVHLFWVDERCVPPDDPESNYGMTDRLLLGKINIPGKNIHRIRGEADPVAEAGRYSEEILKYTRHENKIPVFDIVILGMGEDGHTASIFPGNSELLYSDRICDTAIHPVSGQKRVTITGKVINNADAIIFIVTGQDKADIVSKIIGKRAEAVMFPASHIFSVRGNTTWLLDEEASRFLN